MFIQWEITQLRIGRCYVSYKFLSILGINEIYFNTIGIFVLFLLYDETDRSTKFPDLKLWATSLFTRLLLFLQSLLPYLIS